MTARGLLGQQEGDSGAHDAALGLAWSTRSGCGWVLRLLARVGPLGIWEGTREALIDWGATPAAAARFLERRSAFCIDRAHEELSEHGLGFIPYGHDLYPLEVAELEFPPAGLFVKGAVDNWARLLASPRVTIVGTRRATSYGLRAAEAMTAAFAHRGVVVVSGLALGIDGRAHRVALDHGGSTVAVLGCGADVVYPPRHRDLYGRVAKEGLVVSEFPPGTPPARWTFPRRNRVLAALGDGVLVVEGSRVSGAMQTASAALELGRPVFSVPGPITGSSHQGCNWLIYDGAVPAIEPCVTVEEFLERTRIERNGRPCSEPPQACRGEVLGGSEVWPEARVILDILAIGPRSIDELVRSCGLSARSIAVIMAGLEIEGAVVRSGGAYDIRAP